MPKQKKKHKPGVIRDTPSIDRMQLQAILHEKLSPFELIALDKECDRLQKDAVARNTIPYICDTHKLDYGIALRILKDRYGFETPKLKEFFDLVQDYMTDYDQGRLNLTEILNTLEHEDNIRLTWKVNFDGFR